MTERPLQHVREGFERTVAGTGYRTTTTAVVEQCIDGFLKHALFVVHDDLGSTEIEQTLQAVVAVDHTTVEVVEVRGRKAATVELHHWAQFWRDHWDNVEDHGAWIVDPVAAFIATVECRNDLQALDRLLLTLSGESLDALWRIDLCTKLDLFVVEVDASN